MVEKKLPGGTDSTRKFISSNRNFSNLLKAFYNFYLQVGNRNVWFKIISVRLNMLVVNGIPRPKFENVFSAETFDLALSKF